ncbi:MAG: Asp-tRNA(Asn)/Glu-tRNA(Gln) amidotransferase subunit GatC [Alphaproteobacteria bacterium]|nr:Asp-tRNA(Asn)/Glu-tRNA(Gln) amidotransferase subunit GatC [Alphaproteobacteria bacterium]
MSLDQETVKRIATLARLKLDAERMGSMQHALNSILHFVEQLNEVDTSHVEEMVGGNRAIMPFRPDQVTDGNCVDKILGNAPEVTCNMFVVPKVVE